jgi:hypothetical protein
MRWVISWDLSMTDKNRRETERRKKMITVGPQEER